MFKSLILLPLQLHSSLSLHNLAYNTIPGAHSSAHSLARFKIPLSYVCAVALAHILQYTDFFAYSRGWAILIDGKQVHCCLTDTNYF